MRAPVTHQPIEDFAIPPGAPADVAAAHERYSTLVGKLREQRAALGVAEEAIEQARRDDVDALGRKLAEGGKRPADPHVGERKARDHFAELRDEVAALESGVDHAGTAVADTIEAAREAWLDALRAEQAEAEGRFHTAVGEAGEALDALAAPAETLPWLQGFAAWKTEGSYRGEQGPAGFRRSLPEPIAEAFSALSALSATLHPLPPPPPTSAELRVERHRKAEQERAEEREVQRQDKRRRARDVA